jgi:hypothetical protein
MIAAVVLLAQLGGGTPGANPERRLPNGGYYTPLFKTCRSGSGQCSTSPVTVADGRSSYAMHASPCETLPGVPNVIAPTRCRAT